MILKNRQCEYELWLLENYSEEIHCEEDLERLVKEGTYENEFLENNREEY